MLNQDFKEFIELLNTHNVEYLVVGAYAVAIYGHPRYTGDIDFWIQTSSENADRLMLVIKDFGFQSLGLTKEDFMNKDCVLQLGYEPNRIDILTSLSGINFDDAYPLRNIITTDQISIQYIDLKSLINNKQATGRAKDISDIEYLTKKK